MTTSMWPLWASGPCPCRERSRLQPWPTALQALPAASVCETPRQETLLSRQGLKLSSISQGQIRAESSRRRVDSAVPGKVALRSRCRFAGSVLPVPTNYTETQALLDPRGDSRQAGTDAFPTGAVGVSRGGPAAGPTAHPFTDFSKSARARSPDTPGLDPARKTESLCLCGACPLEGVGS